MSAKHYRIFFADELRGPFRPVTLCEDITFDEEEAKVFAWTLLVQGFAIMLRECDPAACKEEEL